MNSFINRLTRQCIVPGIILGVSSFMVPCILEALGLIESANAFLGFICFTIVPLLIVVSLILVRLALRSRKHLDCNSSIATLFLYLILSLSYIMSWAVKLQYGEKGPLMTEWIFAAAAILLGGSVCWLIYSFALHCVSVCRHSGTKDKMKFWLRSSLTAFLLFVFFNILPMWILALWPIFIIWICKIAFLFFG